MRAVTVKGFISPEELGITLSHEHLLIDATCLWKSPNEASERQLVEAPVAMENLWMLRKNRFASKDNLKLDDMEVAVSELELFKRSGGSSLVDVTVAGIGRDPLALRKISEETGVNILCGTGWYVAASHPPYVKRNDIDELCEIMVRELTEGIGETGIRAGVIGEIGCDVPLHPDEEKVLRAAAGAQKETGAPLTIHCDYVDREKMSVVKNTSTYLDIIQSEDANMDKVYMSHLDYALVSESWTLPLDHHKFIMDKYGVTLNFDCFGHNYPYIFPRFYLTDRERVAAVVELCKQGYDRQLMLSQDVCFKIHMAKYGGDGYAHILENIVPELEYRGVTRKQIRNMLIENPKRIFAYKLGY